MSFALLIVGCIALLFGIAQLRDWKAQRGDFSNWIVSDATSANRRAWFVFVWVQVLALLIVGLTAISGGIWLMLK